MRDRPVEKLGFPLIGNSEMETINYSDPDFNFLMLKDKSTLEYCKDTSIFLFDEDEVNDMKEEIIEIDELERSLVESIWQDDSNRLLSLAGKESYQATLNPATAARLLRLACRLDSVECAEILIEGDTGAEVHINEMDMFGRTPLHNAAEMHSTKCIDLLLRKNARTDLRSKDGNYLLALDIALASKRMQVDWSPKESVEELLVLLRARDFSAIRLLARATKEVKNVAYKRAREGRAVELAFLLLVAADKFRSGSSNINIPQFLWKKCHQHALHMDRKIFIGGLPPSVDSDYLKEIFQAEFGPIEEAMVMYTRLSDGHIYSRGFGFVIFKQEETAAMAICTRFITISGKEVEIKSAVPKKSLETKVSNSSQPQLILQKAPVITTGRLSPKTHDHDIFSLSEQSLPPWVTRFRQWLPVFLTEACKQLGEGEWYPLSSIKGDFRATCRMEMDHVSLGFLKLSDFMRAFPGLCRMKVVPTGNGAATHMVICPSHSNLHNQLLQKKGQKNLVTAYPSYQPSKADELPLSLPTFEVNEDVSVDKEDGSLEKTYIDYGGREGGGLSSNPAGTNMVDSIWRQGGREGSLEKTYIDYGGREGGGLSSNPADKEDGSLEKTYIDYGGREGGGLSSNPAGTNMVDSICQRLRSTQLTKLGWNLMLTANGEYATDESMHPPSAGFMHASTSRLPNDRSYFEKEWFYHVLEKGLCTVCCSHSQPTWYIVPCNHKVCTRCTNQFEGNRKMCIICASKVVEVKLISTQATLLKSDFPAVSDRKQSKQSLQLSQRATPCRKNDTCQVKYACRGATATVLCLPCRHKITCLKCIPWSGTPEFVNLRSCTTCGSPSDGIEFPDK